MVCFCGHSVIDGIRAASYDRKPNDQTGSTAGSEGEMHLDALWPSLLGTQLHGTRNDVAHEDASFVRPETSN
jgi:hypothetical protein